MTNTLDWDDENKSGLNDNSSSRRDSKNLEPHLKNTKCGIACFYPQWLQILASKKTYVIVYSVAGMIQFIVSSYMIGTLSTIEKQFNMSSRKSGIMAGAWEIGSGITTTLITYIAAKGHRTRWVGMGMVLVGISCFIRTLPYTIFGPGETIKLYTKEYKRDQITDSNSTNIIMMGMNVNCGNDNGVVDTFAYCIFILANLILGMGMAVYWTCGAAYLDDNVRKTIVPALLSIVQIIRLFGPTIGFIISSYALKIYVDPSLTPTITNEDPRWIGAWWLGWFPIGVACWTIASMLLLFPRELPRAALRRQNFPIETKILSWSDFKISAMRILKNNIIIFNTLSSICFAMGVMGYWTFMPKYMESQFRLTASQSNFISGTIGILSNGLGILTSGLVITKLKPSARFISGWNTLVDFLYTIGVLSYSWLSCTEQQYHGHWNNDHIWNLTETCNLNYKCGNDIQFAPVCDLNRGLAYYSPCHAGCSTSSKINGTLVYSNCSCVPNMSSVVDGLCPVDCSTNVLIFVIVMGILNYIAASGRSGNMLIQFRCVDEKDKSLSIGITEGLVIFLAFLPAPTLYGMIMDWACIVWGDNCGSPGNCWIYDGQRLQLFNYASSSCFLMSTILDVFVWYYTKGLKLYDENSNANEENGREMQDYQKISVVKDPKDEMSS